MRKIREKMRRSEGGKKRTRKTGRGGGRAGRDRVKVEKYRQGGEGRE